MLLREYRDRDGFKYLLNLESISNVQVGFDYDSFDDLSDDTYITVFFGGVIFYTTKAVYLQMLDEINKANNIKCGYSDTKEDCCPSEDIRPSISMYYVKRKIMEADYMDADAKIRLLADLDIVM